MRTARKRRRRDAADLVLADALGVTPRTIRNWKKRLAGASSQTRSALQLGRQGKQWRFDLPKERREFMAYVRRLRQWASGFSQVPLTTSALQSAFLSSDPSDYRPHRADRFVKEFVRDLGLDSTNRVEEVEILRLAIALKRSTSASSVDPGGDGSIGLPFEDWRKMVENYVSMVSIVASRFQCPVKDFPRYWPLYLREWNQSVRSGKLVNYVAGPQAFNDRYQGPVNIERNELQPLTEAEIHTECARLEEVWPEAEQWHKAETSHRGRWEIQTLCEAAVRLLQQRKPVNGKNLAPLLFRDPTVQHCYSLHQRHMALRRQGFDVFPHPTAYKHGKCGLSLSEFRQRYCPEDIERAKAAAQRADASDINRGSKSNDGEVVVEREVLKNMMQPGEKSQQSIDPAWAAMHRRRLTDDPEIEKWFAGLSDEEQKKALELLRDPFSEGELRRKANCKLNFPA